MTTNNVTAFLDPIGRIIVGTLVSETDELFKVQSPAVVHIQPNPQTNNLQLQILPLMFKELLGDKSSPPIFSYKKKNITSMENMVFAPQFYKQYAQVSGSFEPEAPEPEAPAKGSVVELFDAKDSE